MIEAASTAKEVAPTAKLEAHFDCARGRTHLRHCFAKSPLKIAKTFPREQGIAVCVMDCSPGLLAGDCYEMEWHLGEGTNVEVSTQGFTRVHPSRTSPCVLRQKINLCADSHLEYFPEPLMLYRDAALFSMTEVDLAPTSTLLWGEIVCAGRVERGEAFAFQQWRSRTRVRCNGKLLYVAQNALCPERFDPTRVGAWGIYTHAGTFTVFSPTVGADLLAPLREILDEQMQANPHLWGGASLLEQGGLIVSLLGRRAHDLQELTHRLRLCWRDLLRSG